MSWSRQVCRGQQELRSELPVDLLPGSPGSSEVLLHLGLPSLHRDIFFRVAVRFFLFYTVRFLERELVRLGLRFWVLSPKQRPDLRFYLFVAERLLHQLQLQQLREVLRLSVPVWNILE